MKTLWLLVATLFLMSFAACKSNSTDLNNETTDVSEIVAKFGAKIVAPSEVGADKFDLDGISSVTVDQAIAILQDIRNHKDSQKSSTRSNVTKGDGVFYILMSEKVSDCFKLSIQLNMMELKDGTLLYKNYQTDCASSVCTLYVSGFSLSNDNVNNGSYKFQSQGYLNFMVIDGGVKYVKIPLVIQGVFDPTTQNAEFSYVL